ncbi:class I SAM-dependent methyltransferase [Sphingomonas sp. ASY06-1R]|uniref:class I SAM-dependent methyltransferase n=1 Tax=Sphingomonas sp. ASY06-1R TaxID=3445771 RepID=UPI003FA1D1BA
MPASPDLTDVLAVLIDADGPISIERFMAAANAHYYATRPAIGASGDFVTAPEISQMFGEMIGLALADLWQRTGSPADAVLVELGPGRGTLAADMLRAMKVAGLSPQVHLVETSPLLRQQQAERVPHAIWHEGIETLPADCPLLIVANEFFDALPIRQFIKTGGGWSERLVARAETGFALVAGPPSAMPQTDAAEAADGAILESNPSARALMTALTRRLATQGGALLAIDYGHVDGGFGDTLQAVQDHRFADPLLAPGTRDLTAHVDFSALARSARDAGGQVWGPAEQGQWLVALGLSNRAAMLARRTPDQAETIGAAYRRLTHPEAMGTLFKVMGVTAPHWPEPGGFLT